MKSTKPRMKSNHFAEGGKMSEKKDVEPLDVGAPERVDWRTAQGLSKYVHFDENGNLEVDGATKLSGGLAPTKTIRLSPSNFASDLVFNIFIEIPSANTGIYTFFGSAENYDEGSKYLCIGEYSKNTSQGGFNYVRAYYMYDNGMTINIIEYDGSTDTVNSATLSPITNP